MYYIHVPAQPQVVVSITSEDVPMWRRQDDPKAPATSPETRPPQPVVSQQVAPPAAPVAAVSISPPSSARPASAPSGYLTKGLVLKGEITGREDLLVEGEVHGQIRIADGRVTIGPGGRVVACVEAREIVVRGKVKGDLRAVEQVQIGGTGSVIGDIVTPRIAIDEGAELRGNLDTTRPEQRHAARAASTVASTAGAVSTNADKPEGRPATLPAALQAKEVAPGA